MSGANLITYTFNGETRTVYEWSIVTGMSEATVRRHIRLGLPMERLEENHGDFNETDWWKLVNSQDASTTYERLDDDFNAQDYARRHGYGEDD